MINLNKCWTWALQFAETNDHCVYSIASLHLFCVLFVCLSATLSFPCYFWQKRYKKTSRLWPWPCDFRWPWARGIVFCKHTYRKYTSCVHIIYQYFFDLWLGHFKLTEVLLEHFWLNALPFLLLLLWIFHSIIKCFIYTQLTQNNFISAYMYIDLLMHVHTSVLYSVLKRYCILNLPSLYMRVWFVLGHH